MTTMTSVKIRRWILVVITLLIFGVFVGQLLQIQIVDAEEYKKKTQGRTLSSQMRKAVRGEIMDRNGKPIVVNEMGHIIAIDRPFLPTGDEQNQVLLRLMSYCDQLGEEWIDNLPITKEQPYLFLEDKEDELLRLRNHLDTQPYATAEQMMFWLIEKYKLEDYSPVDARRLAGVRYEMERRDFSNKIPYTFAEDITLESVIFLKERNFELPGITPESKALRKYAVDDLAPHIIGQIGPLYAEEYAKLKEEGKIFSENAPEFDTRGYTMDDIIGKGGIEEALEDILRGTNGKREISTDAQGEIIEFFDSIPPVPGNTVYLTLDEDLQRLAQDVLAAQIEFLRTAPSAPAEARNADSGAVIAIEVKTGRILAVASNPTYTLSDYRANYTEVSQRDGTPLLDRAIVGAYAPGSIYKPVTAISALREGVATPHSYFTCTYVYDFFAPSYTPKCLFHHGNINVIRALQESCNIYFYEAGRLAGIDALDKTAIGLGLGEPTGIEIYENPGQRSNPETKKAIGNGEWYAADTIQSAIGQFDNKFSPLQLANYAATLANRGKRMELTLINEVRDYTQENIIHAFEPKVASEMNDVDPEAFETVIEGMVNASHIGTARGTFGNYPISVASKTGTPEIGNAEVNSTFIAFAPAEDPEIAIVVVIEKGWHGYTGASVAKALFDQYFGIDDVWAPVTNGPDQLKKQRIAEAIASGEYIPSESTVPDSSAYIPRENPAPVEPTLPSSALPPENPVKEEPALPESSAPPAEEKPTKTDIAPSRREGEADGDVNPPPTRQKSSEP